MTTVTATQARQNLFEILKQSARGHVPFKITSKNGDVVMLSGADYESLVETLQLLSTPGVRKGIEEARQDIKAGRTRSLKDVFGR
ncbi:MAG: type II toxin-antitoxin system Phd/YefM family antitoxin [Candidatus Omnitrophica bacterium]|nr:type II toxin-antitoxin system Phd/YefM family antitoxin [Candidatus Omnitrophota bacterium]